jgi:flagellar basal-body rod modification protein FlgD
MVGRDVLVASSYGELSDGAIINGAVDLPNAVSNLTVGVYDQSGRLVHSIEMGLQPSGMAEFSWDGFTTDGKVTPPGRYEFRSEAVNGGINEAFDVMMATQVQSVSMTSGGGGLSLQLAGLGQVDFSEIRQIR